jgi:hypothetical protein
MLKEKGIDLTALEKDALTTLLTIRSEAPDTAFYRSVTEADAVIAEIDEDQAKAYDPYVQGRVRWSITKKALRKLYRILLDEGHPPYEHPPRAPVIDIDHPYLTTVEAEYDRAMQHEGEQEKERRYAFDLLEELVVFDPPDVVLDMLVFRTLGVDRRPDDWNFAGSKYAWWER